MIPKFTVVTITYNSSKFVRQAIESVLTQSYTNFEYIISDDCSFDDTWHIIQEYKDPRIRAWQNDNTLGEYGNRNKTLFEARGEYIIWIDGDDILFRDSLNKFMNYLSFFPNVGMIWGVPHLNFNFCVLPFEFVPLETLSILYRTVIPSAYIGFAETLFRTTIIKEIGGMSENFKIGDVYIKKRLACICNTLMVPLGFSFWREHSNQASKKALIGNQSFKDALMIDNEIRSLLLIDNQMLYKNIIKNIKIRQIKFLIVNTLFRFKFKLFLEMFQKLDLPYYYLLYFFSKAEAHYQFNRNGENPLINNYNFTK